MLSTICLFTAMVYNVSAQSSETSDSTTIEVPIEDVNMVELTFDRTFPLGPFGTNIGRDLNGFSARYLNQTKSESYSLIGIQFAFVHIGSLDGTVFDVVNFTDETSSNIVSLELIYRLYLPYYYKIVEPFVEFGLGPQVFYTSTSTTFLDGSNETDFNFNAADFGFVAHAEVGVTIKLVRNLFATTKFGYTNGIATTYDVPQEELTTEFPLDSFSQLTSQTNNLRFHIGLSYTF